MLDKLKAAWPIILTVLGVITAVASIINARLPKDAEGNVTPPKNWGAFAWRVLIDLLSWVPQPGKSGIAGPVNLPGLQSSDKPDKTGLLVLCVAGLALSACASDPMTTYYRSVSTVAIGASQAYHQLDRYDAGKQAAIVAISKTDAKRAADELAAWLPVYDKARLGLDAISGIAKGALAAGPAIELAVDKKKQIGEWIARLMAAAAEVVKILDAAGVIKGGE